MLPLHTQKSLDQLTWNEIQKLHASLGLKATSTTRTRRDYQNRIVAAMPQPIAEPEAVATPLTCATCPLARHIDGNRYCCGLTDAVVRGHWEANTDCYDAVTDQAETGTIEPAAEIAPQETATETESPIAQPEQTPVATIATTTDDAPPNRGDNGRGRVTSSLPVPTVTIASIPHATKPKADDNFMTAFTKESEGDRKFNDLAYLSQLEMEAQLAIERTAIGSEEEAIAYAHLRQIERDVEFNNRPEPKPQPSPAIQQLETQMKELKTDVFKLFKIEPFDQSILPACDESEQPAIQSEPEPEGTIHWTTPLLRGVIVGKKGATRQFYIRNDEIFIVLSGEFTAGESKHPNIRHRQIREAINLGGTFNPRTFKISPNFERDTQACNGGRICQECDGRWWAWANGNPTGHPFFDRETACKYLKKVSQNQRQELARKSVICAK